MELLEPTFLFLSVELLEPVELLETVQLLESVELLEAEGWAVKLHVVEHAQYLIQVAYLAYHVSVDRNQFHPDDILTCRDGRLFLFVLCAFQYDPPLLGSKVRENDHLLRRTLEIVLLARCALTALRVASRARRSVSKPGGGGEPSSFLFPCLFSSMDYCALDLLDL